MPSTTSQMLFIASLHHKRTAASVGEYNKVIWYYQLS